MPVNLKAKTVLVWDNGIFAEIAVTLAKSFGRVLYYVPWTNGYPKSNALLIGHGVEGIERVSSPWAFFDDIDIWVFPDVYEGELQEWLAEPRQAGVGLPDGRLARARPAEVQARDQEARHRHRPLQGDHRAGCAAVAPEEAR
jgi:hypothetical protein